MDVCPNEVKRVMNTANVQQMIHGHTHRPAIHTIALDQQQSGQRIVLGAWHHEASILQYNADGTFELQSFIIK